MTDLPSIPFRGYKLMVIDVEGNGQQPPKIIEIAALPIMTDIVNLSRCG